MVVIGKILYFLRKPIDFSLPALILLMNTTVANPAPIPSLLDDPETQFEFFLSTVTLPEQPVFRETYLQMLRKHFEKTPDFPQKIASAKKKAHAMTTKLHGRHRRGCSRHYWKIEKWVVREECGLNWWITPLDLDPNLVLE